MSGDPIWRRIASNIFKTQMTIVDHRSFAAIIRAAIRSGDLESVSI